ncbi:MAG: hypothetical protein ACE5J9_08360 [Methanosarcinales archaeon]
MELEKEQFAWLEGFERIVGRRRPEVDLVNIRLARKEFKPLIVGYAYTDFHGKLWIAIRDFP